MCVDIDRQKREKGSRYDKENEKNAEDAKKEETKRRPAVVKAFEARQKKIGEIINKAVKGGTDKVK